MPLPKEWAVEIVFQGRSIRTRVKANSPEEATEHVLKTIDVFVEDEPDPWTDEVSAEGRQ